MHRFSDNTKKASSVKLSDYEKYEKLGEGTYGIVYRGKCLKTGLPVALKKVKIGSDTDGIPITTVREISLLKELKHINIVHLLNVIIENGRMYLIFEFVTMDLKKYLNTKSTRLDLRLIKVLMYQTVQGILYCHLRRVIHRDLKPQNILIDSSNVIKIADFGLARCFNLPFRVYTHEIVTLWYRAPEILLGAERYSCAVDIWSLGCIFAEIALKKPIFAGDCEADQLFKIFSVLATPNETLWPGVTALPEYKCEFPNWKERTLNKKMENALDDVGLDLLDSMLTYDPKKRPDARMILRHEFFDDVDLTAIPASYP